MLNENGKAIIAALFIAVIWFGILLAVHSGLDSSHSFYRFTVLLGGELPGGFIQFLLYVVFCFGMVRIILDQQNIRKERLAFKKGYLPEKEGYLLSPVDINELRKRVEYKEGAAGKSLLSELIKKVCMKFRSNKSSSEALEILTQQVRINIAMQESSQSFIRYSAWAIPSIGFIGTIIGIAQALGNISVSMDAKSIGKVTSALELAFDTTLLALLLSLILMFFFHWIQEKAERLHLGIEQHITENLINRIWKG